MKMKWFKRLFLLSAVLVAVLAIAPFFVSVDDYRPRIEQLLSEKLKEPVSIRRVRLAGLPLPHVVADGIEIGKADIKVGRIAVTPDLLSMLSDTKVIRSIGIEGLVLNQRALDRIPAWTQADPKAKPAGFTVQVRAIHLDGALLQLQKTTFGPVDARISLAANGFPERADIATRDGKFKARVKPAGGKFGIEVDAKGWRPPTGPPILFDELQIRGMATANEANLTDVRAKLYGGNVAGVTTVGWRKGLQLKGSYQVSGIELRDLVPLFSQQTKLSGRLTAKPVFSGSAPSAAQFQNALRLETPFDIRDGVLQGIDIQKAASSLLSKDSGGQTRFDTLSGHYALERGTQRITGLKVASGSLAANGNVTIAPSKALS
ncbi:MAG: AsmA family protein, partial [Burkholderiales bacterium]|nr:AsmA family protein [Burkholderiales bacterium]